MIVIGRNGFHHIPGYVIHNQMLNEKICDCLENTLYEHHDVIRLNFVKKK